MTGRVHSIESFGTVDGPGVRMVVFLQGCPMRCLYCHNPDTWENAGGKLVTVEEILRQFEASRHFYREGGLTITGGEPLVQLDFVTELFQAAQESGIHTCLDTSGITFRPVDPDCLKKMDRLLAFTNLVLLDLKHMDEDAHKRLTGHSNSHILEFARYLDKRRTPVWIRHVVAPGITDREADLYRLGRFIGSLGNVKALDVLPYHDMGKVKYESLGLSYPLNDTPALSSEQAVAAKKVILTGIRDVRNGK